MVTHDRIRLTGLLPESPANRGAFSFAGGRCRGEVLASASGGGEVRGMQRSDSERRIAGGDGGLPPPVRRLLGCDCSRTADRPEAAGRARRRRRRRQYRRARRLDGRRDKRVGVRARREVRRPVPLLPDQLLPLGRQAAGMACVSGDAAGGRSRRPRAQHLEHERQRHLRELSAPVRERADHLEAPGPLARQLRPQRRCRDGAFPLGHRDPRPNHPGRAPETDIALIAQNAQVGNTYQQAREAELRLLAGAGTSRLHRRAAGVRGDRESGRVPRVRWNPSDCRRPAVLGDHRVRQSRAARPPGRLRLSTAPLRPT